jgi:hypothetical protein
LDYKGMFTDIVIHRMSVKPALLTLCLWRDSNPLPPPYHGGIHPIEPQRRVKGSPYQCPAGIRWGHYRVVDLSCLMEESNPRQDVTTVLCFHYTNKAEYHPNSRAVFRV